MKLSPLGLAALLAAVIGGCDDPASPGGPVAAVELSSAALTVGPMESALLVATARNSAGEALEGREVHWETSNPLVATVAVTGQVLGVGYGSATVTGTVEGVSAEAQVTVTATKPLHLAGSWRMQSFEGKAVPATYAFFPDEPTDDGVVDVEIRLDSARAQMRDDGIYTFRQYCFSELHDDVVRFRYCWGDHGGFAISQPGVVSLWSEYIQNLTASGTVTPTGGLALTEPLWLGEAPRPTIWTRAN